ncbi:MAG TPA: TldD/PmbA family protein [Acidimicrobiales bacterium]|nr:TldD/PmbA family protein [Acidimicrobiales bacterium]
MSETLVDREILQRVLGAAMQRGGEFAEVFVEDRVTSSAVLDQRRVEELNSGHDRGAGIRVVVGDTTGFAHTSDLSEGGLRRAAQAAASVARGGGGGVREVALDALNSRASLAVVAPGDVDKARKIELLMQADDVARSEGASVRQVQVAVGDSSRRFVVANSDGSFAADHQVRTRFNISCVASGDTGMQTGYRPIAGTRGFEILSPETVAEAARGAARQAITKLDARPAPSGDLPVVLAGGSGGILFHEACGHGLEADAVLKQASVYAGKLGQRVASPLVTLVDDGTVQGEWGYLGIDDEGRPAARNVLIENGVLTDYMWDFLRARKEGRRSSGNGRRQSYQYLPMVRMTNTYLLAGDADADEIVAQTPYGVYVAQLGGGQVDTATGDFVFGMTAAFLIEDGKITTPLRDCNLIGNGPDVLQRVDAVASDFSMTPGTCGKDGQQVPVGTGQATMRLTGVTIGGTAS